jgi:hypothetical protein
MTPDPPYPTISQALLLIVVFAVAEFATVIPLNVADHLLGTSLGKHPAATVAIPASHTRAW